MANRRKHERRELMLAAVGTGLIVALAILVVVLVVAFVFVLKRAPRK